MAHRIYPLLALALFLHIVFAEEFNCKVTLSGREFDLTQLYGPHNLTRTVTTTPSKVVQWLEFDLCDKLKRNNNPDSDQCPEGTRACLVETNQRDNEQDRIVRVIPIATEDKLGVTHTVLSEKDGINLIFHGPSYPPADSEPPSEIVQDQSLDLDIICPPDGAESMAPTFGSYDGKVMKVEWKHQVVCSKGDSKPSDDDKSDDIKKKTGSGIGYFFLVLLIAFLAYFVIGAYYNYNNYGASGWDLVPHRDFWRDVPHLLRDVVSHLCSFGRSRRGYVQV